MAEIQKVQPPKPLSCTIDKDGVKHTTWNETELRRYLENTTDTVFLVTTDAGMKAPIVVEPLRQVLGSNG